MSNVFKPWWRRFVRWFVVRTKQSERKYWRMACEEERAHLVTKFNLEEAQAEVVELMRQVDVWRTEYHKLESLNDKLLARRDRINAILRQRGPRPLRLP